MKQFEVNKMYRINGSGTIEIKKRSACFVTYEGTTRGGTKVSGKKKVITDGLLGHKEYILIPSIYPSMKYFCFADNEI